jgi:site-specific recombinase XerD
METFNQFLNKQHSPKTVRTYLYYVDAFLVRFPNALELQYLDIINYINEKQTQYKGSTSVTVILMSVKRYYDYLFYVGKRDDHPCQRLNLKQQGRVGIQFQDLFSTAELRTLMNRENRFAALDLKNKATISLLICQGLTIAELVNLNAEDIDLDLCTIYIRKSYRTERRTLELENTQVRLIEKYLTECRPKLNKNNSQKLLINIRGAKETIEGVQGMLKPLQALFPDRSLNALTIRQSVIANWLNEKKLPLEDVQILAGHRWPSSTERYIRLDLSEQRKLINKFHPLK